MAVEEEKTTVEKQIDALNSLTLETSEIMKTLSPDQIVESGITDKILEIQKKLHALQGE